ncbi:MAG: rhodanese-like domain-containing protein [Betaproteobacteria bacterium]|jgi:rhodanese-related sulfurtransferase|nr:rhodanese-like domain-containing protein [Pseudomonadota bacterium]NBO04698.1 rhodanese-like domain-containing protein [Betaproteobacteria bacterium]NBO94876.1 rhodanese-like domain-containing protein [Betaproteobacteria bacterium]NBP34399.1 rhodanese-like domain-containing protein [Betaproteobacteria bacterium]NBP36920.1 rhodanese-like domain-containing protein [Betaproteobacteria bacterium]
MQFFVDNLFLIVMALVSGGLLLWPSIRDRAGGERLDTVSATRLMNDEEPTLIDVRSPAEYEAGHLLRAKSIPLVDLPKRVSEIKGKKPVLVLDTDGSKAAKASAIIREAGIERVYSLAGGVAAWRAASLPLVKS